MRKRKGFTLMELIIVVIIIAILASVGLPQFFKAAGKAKEARAKHNLGEIRKVELAYESATGSWDTFTTTNSPVITVDIDSDGTTDISMTFTDDVYKYDVTGTTAQAVTTATGLDSPLTISLPTGAVNW